MLWGGNTGTTATCGTAVCRGKCLRSVPRAQTFQEKKGPAMLFFKTLKGLWKCRKALVKGQHTNLTV